MLVYNTELIALILIKITASCRPCWQRRILGQMVVGELFTEFRVMRRDPPTSQTLPDQYLSARVVTRMAGNSRFCARSRQLGPGVCSADKANLAGTPRWIFRSHRNKTLNTTRTRTNFREELKAAWAIKRAPQIKDQDRHSHQYPNIDATLQGASTGAVMPKGLLGIPTSKVVLTDKGQ